MSKNLCGALVIMLVFATTIASPPAAQAAAGTPTFASPTHMAQIQERGKLRIGSRQDNPPFQSKNPMTGRMEGFDADIGREIARAIFGNVSDIDEKIEWVPVVAATRIPTLNSNSADMIISTFSMTDERRQQIDFSDVYFYTGQRILVKKANNSVKDVKDLNGRTVCTTRGSTSEKVLTSQAPQVKLLLLDDFPACLLSLQQDKVEAISTDETILFSLVKQDPNTKVVGPPVTQDTYGIGVRKGRPEFVSFINEQLATMVTNGQWAKFYKQWVSPFSGQEMKAPAK